VLKKINNNKVLILGVSSFAGYSFANYLANKQFNIIGSYNNKKNYHFKKNKYLKLIKIDLEKENNLLVKTVKKYKPNYIIDFASICMVNESWTHPLKYFKINSLSRIKFIQYISSKDYVRKFIYISTPEVFGDTNKSLNEKLNVYKPSTPYASSKLFVENLIKNFSDKNKFNIARFSNFYGPEQPLYRLIPKIIFSIKNNKKFPLHGNGSSKRNYLYSQDFCEGIFKIMKSKTQNQTYHFSGKKLYSVKEIVNKVCKIFTKDYKEFVIQKKDRTNKDNIYKLNCDLTCKLLNWKPKVSIDTGIKEIIKSMNIKNDKKNSKPTFFKI